MSILYPVGERQCEARVEELRAEFGAILSEQIIEAEALDFLWEARVAERYLGQHFGAGLGDGDARDELSRVAVLSLLRGYWSVGICLVDGQGGAVDLLWQLVFESETEAQSAFESMH